jgi:hypothetical protein
MIRRLCATLALSAVAALALAGHAPANHRLAHKVRALTAKLNCLQKYPVYAFADYAYFEFASDTADKGGSQNSLDVLVPPVPTISALDFNYGSTIGSSDAFLLGVKRTSRCNAKFATATNPVSFARVVSTAKMSRLR